MNSFRRAILCLSGLFLVSGAALATPAYARDNETMGGETIVKPAAQQIADTNDSDTPLNPRDLTTKFKEQAQQKIEEQKSKVQEQTQQKRQQSCQARKSNLQKRMTNSVDHAQKLKSVFDSIYTKAKDFHDNKQVDTLNYETLVSAVDSSSANVTSNITALQDLNVSVDCSQSNVANSVSAFKEAVASTRDSLKQYRSSITDLISAIKTANSADDTSTDNPDQGSQ